MDTVIGFFVLDCRFLKNRRFFKWITFLTCLVITGFAINCSQMTKPEQRPSKIISADTIWAANGTHKVTCDLYIQALLSIGDNSKVFIDSTVTIFVGSQNQTAILRIGKGTTLYFGKGASINVCYTSNRLEAGAIIANGTESDSIRFTNDANCNQWGFQGSTADRNSGGIRIGPRATDQTSLKYCIVENATAGINLVAPSFELTNSSISHCINEGIIFSSIVSQIPYIEEAFGCIRDSNDFSNNDISENGGYPIIIGARDIGMLSMSNKLNCFMKMGIFVIGHYIDSTCIWKNFGCPYIISGEVSLGSKNSITISPGCRLEFLPSTNNYNSFLKSGWENGHIIAHGTSSDSIVFTRHGDVGTWGSTYYPGYANMVTYNNGVGIQGRGLSMRYCIIEYAITGIHMVDGELSNSTISNCKLQGFTGNPSDSQYFLNNKIKDNGEYPIVIGAEDVGKLSGNGDFSGNGRNAIYVIGGEISENSTWKRHEIPYIIDSCINVSGAVMTINPMCRLEFCKPNSFLRIADKGALIAQGFQNDPIIFTKTTDTEYWGYSMGGIWISRTASSNTTLSYCDVSQTTSGIYVEAAVSIMNCYIHDNRSYGIDFAASGLDSNVKNNLFDNNPSGDIHQ